MKTVLDQLQQVDTNQLAYEANYHPRAILRLQHAYKALSDDNDAIWQAEAEGILEITLRSRTQTLTVALDSKRSSELAMMLGEMLGDKLHHLQERIIMEHEEIRNGEGPKTATLLTLIMTPVDEQGMALPPAA